MTVLHSKRRFLQRKLQHASRIFLLLINYHYIGHVLLYILKTQRRHNNKLDGVVIATIRQE